MKKFHFKLRGLANIKHAMERQVKQELSEIQHSCLRRQEEIRTAGEKISEWSRYYNGVLGRGARWIELGAIDHHLQRLYRFREQALIGLEVLERKKADLIRQFEEIRREVKMLEHLHERRFGEYCAELRVEEQKEADDLALVRYVRERASV